MRLGAVIRQRTLQWVHGLVTVVMVVAIDFTVTENLEQEEISVEQAFRDLIEFETRCGHPPTDGSPGIPDERTQALRIRLITEEYVELTTALTAGDLPEIADGIADLIYVCIGTAVRLGLDLPQIWQAVACANLAKFGPGSHREPDGKISKPANWRHPDIAVILANQRPIAETYGKASDTPSLGNNSWDSPCEYQISKMIPSLPQRQDGTRKQLTDLCSVGNRLGMYDAVDWIKRRHDMPTEADSVSSEPSVDGNLSDGLATVPMAKNERERLP